jgi:two-component system, cell cycle response regulator
MAMRFQKSESAFFIFVLVILMSGGLVLYAYDALQGAEATITQAAGAETVSKLKRLLFATSILNAVAVFFGLFFVFPLLRIHVQEEGKLRAMTKTLSARSLTLEQAALTDPLTGMHNRRYFDNALREYLEEFAKIERPVGLMIFDLDHFKHVNDTHGHDVGDEVLRAVAGCLRDMTRYHDVVARLGGEEFAVVAPNMDLDDLVKLAERIREGIAAMPISTSNVRLRITSSVGLAVWNRRENGEELFRRADQNLYQAKKQGRNRVSA